MVFLWKAKILGELRGGDRQLRDNFSGCGACQRFFYKHGLITVASKHPHSQFVLLTRLLTDASSYSGYAAGSVCATFLPLEA